MARFALVRVLLVGKRSRLSGVLKNGECRPGAPATHPIVVSGHHQISGTLIDMTDTDDQQSAPPGRDLIKLLIDRQRPDTASLEPLIDTDDYQDRAGSLAQVAYLWGSQAIKAHTGSTVADASKRPAGIGHLVLAVTKTLAQSSYSSMILKEALRTAPINYEPST